MRFDTPVLQPFCTRSELKLMPSEALFGFAGWLTTRNERTVMSSSDNAGPIAGLVAAFCRENDLEPPRDRWPILLKHPPETAVVKPSAFTGEACAQFEAASDKPRATSTQLHIELRGRLLERARRALDNNQPEVASMLIGSYECLMRAGL